jgi:hypothetical protein
VCELHNQFILVMQLNYENYDGLVIVKAVSNSEKVAVGADVVLSQVKLKVNPL